MRLHTDAKTLQAASAILAKTCQVSAERSTSAYSLFLIDTTAVVAFRSAHQQRCATGTHGEGAADDHP
jgi:hypothetical protein